MSFLVINIPAVPVFVKKEYLYDLQIEGDKLKGEGDLTPGYWVTVKSKPGKALLFETLLTDYGALYDKLPISAFTWKEDIQEEQYPLDYLQLWDSFSYYVTVCKKNFIKGFPVKVLLKNKKTQTGTYLFTIDSCSGDPNLLDCGVSEINPEHKSFNIIKLDNGQFAAQPNNRVLWYDSSLITNRERPDFKACTNDFTCEGKDDWNVAESEDYFYKSKEEDDTSI